GKCQAPGPAAPVPRTVGLRLAAAERAPELLSPARFAEEHRAQSWQLTGAKTARKSVAQKSCGALDWVGWALHARLLSSRWKKGVISPKGGSRRNSIAWLAEPRYEYGWVLADVKPLGISQSAQRIRSGL